MWQEKTWVDQGKNHFSNIRRYRYQFKSSWFYGWVPFKEEFNLEFQTKELTINGDFQGHNAVLLNPDFEINRINVMDWARNAIHIGRAEFDFTLERKNFGSIKPLDFSFTCKVRIRFTDRRLATLFKLTFG